MSGETLKKFGLRNYFGLVFFSKQSKYIFRILVLDALFMRSDINQLIPKVIPNRSAFMPHRSAHFLAHKYPTTMQTTGCFWARILYEPKRMLFMIMPDFTRIRHESLEVITIRYLLVKIVRAYESIEIFLWGFFSRFSVENPLVNCNYWTEFRLVNVWSDRLLLCINRSTLGVGKYVKLLVLHLTSRQSKSVSVGVNSYAASITATTT